MPTSHESILKSLRSLIPSRDCQLDEALVVAELQGTRLLRLIRTQYPTADGIDLGHLQALPRLRVVFEPLPVSGMSHWNGREWIITIARGDSPARQRFTLLHEFKHIIDHGHAQRLYQGTSRVSATDQAERAADYFAGCALVPKAALKMAWGNGLQRLPDLADHFGVSEHAICVRLAQTGLDRPYDREPSPRCARPVPTPRWQPQRFTIPGTRRSYA